MDGSTLNASENKQPQDESAASRKDAEDKCPQFHRPRRGGARRFLGSHTESVLWSSPRKQILNCVMCSQNFDELLKLESHVRSHEEVEHFSLVLKTKNTVLSENAVCDQEMTVPEAPKAIGEHKEKQVKHPSSEEQANTDTKENMKAGADVNVSAEETCVATETRDEPSDPTKEDKGVTKCKRDRKKEISNLQYKLVKRGRGRPSHALKCPECDQAINSKLAMRLHFRTVHRRRGFSNATCDVCGDQFSSLKILKEHLSEKHTLKLSAHNKLYKCPFCDEFFDRKSLLLAHKKEVHPGQTNYMCDDCGKKCHTPSELTIHRRMHTGEKPFQCDTCDLMFRFANSLKEHMRLHTGEKPFQCEICGVKFSRKCNKRRHMISHTGKFSHSCEYCGKGFNDVGPLKIHIRMHTGERPFQCDTCDMRFVTKAQMQCHKAKHTRERTHLCQICGAAFLYSVDLRRHTKIHTGVRNYKCDECDAAFFRLDHLKRHQKSHAANSKRLAKTDWKPRAASKKRNAVNDVQTVPQEDIQVASVITVKTELDSAQVVTGVTATKPTYMLCNATLSSGAEQQELVSHVKQSIIPQVVDSSVGDRSEATQASVVLQQLSSATVFCTMCNVVVSEPGGLQEHLRLVHQVQQ